MKSSNPAGWYREIRVMTKGSKSTPSIIPPSGIDPANTQQVADSINHHFTSIVKDIPVLDMNNLPAYLPAPEPCPSLQEWDVFNQSRHINSRKAGGADGVPARIIREFAFELSKPMMTSSILLINKGPTPVNGSKLLLFLSLRLRSRFGINCALCHLLVAETFVSNWILSDIGDQLDPNQF